MSSTRIRYFAKASRAAVYRALLDAHAVARWMVPAGMTSHVHASGVIFYLLLLGPGEEILFRGVVRSRLNLAFGRPFEFLDARWGWGAVITGFLFALMHPLNLPALYERQCIPSGSRADRWGARAGNAARVTAGDRLRHPGSGAGVNWRHAQWPSQLSPPAIRSIISSERSEGICASLS